MRRWWTPRSLTARVTLLTITAVGGAVALVAVGVYFTVRVQLTGTLDQSLLHRAQRAANSDILVQISGNELIPSWALGAGDVRIAFVSPGVVRTPDMGEPLPLGSDSPEVAVATGLRTWSIRTITTASGTDYRVVAVQAKASDTALVIAQSMDSQQEVLHRLGVVIGGFGLAGLILAGGAGWAVAASSLRPVRRLTHNVEHVARTEDLTPLPVEGTDEIARLSSAFNEMLVSLSASRDRQRQLVADAGHELRTPLTSMRTNLEMLTMAGQTLSTDERDELTSDVIAQMEELTTLIGDLVELSRDEGVAPEITTVSLPDIVEAAVARVRRRAPSIPFDLDLEPWWLEGDPAALERAVTNLLDNAAKFSQDGAGVQVRLADGVLTVDDSGPGISEDDLPHVFDRFYRSADARSLPGSGLGLAIVHQVAERHAGTVTATSAPSGGARLRLELPGSAAG